MGLKKSILSKLVWIVLAFVAFYFVGLTLGFIPQPVKDVVNWGAQNFDQIAILACFLSAVWIIHEFLNRKKRGS